MDGPSLSIQQELASLAKRVEKLEALKASPMMTPPAPRSPATTADGLSPVEELIQSLPPNFRDAQSCEWAAARADYLQHGHAGPTPAGLSVEELACILGEAPIGDLGRAYWLLKHRRLGPLLRGEGAPVQSPVVLPEKQPQAQAAHPIQPLIVDEHGTLRFKENPIVRHLLDTHPSCGLNELARMKFSDEDQQQFAQLIGYSLSGYGTLSYVSDESYDAAASTVHARQQGGQADG